MPPGTSGSPGDLTFTTLEGHPANGRDDDSPQGAMVFGTVMVTANASDNVGVVGVQFRVDGAPLGAEDWSPLTRSWTSTASPGLSGVYGGGEGCRGGISGHRHP